MTSYAAAVEARPDKVAVGESGNTPLTHLATNAGFRAEPDAHGCDARVRDLKFAHLTTNDGLSQGYVVAILQDHRGFMWFATRDGLNRYDGNAFVVYKNDPDDPGSLNSNFIQDLMEDDHGYLWVATNTGVSKFDPASETLCPLPSRPQQFEHY
jgi:ligand-binding sensor domain-containing protein